MPLFCVLVPCVLMCLLVGCTTQFVYLCSCLNCCKCVVIITPPFVRLTQLTLFCLINDYWKISFNIHVCYFVICLVVFYYRYLDVLINNHTSHMQICYFLKIKEGEKLIVLILLSLFIRNGKK